MLALNAYPFFMKKSILIGFRVKHFSSRKSHFSSIRVGLHGRVHLLMEINIFRSRTSFILHRNLSNPS